MKFAPFLLPLLYFLSYSNSGSAQMYGRYQAHSFDLAYGIEYGHRLLSTDSKAGPDLLAIQNRNNSERGKAHWRLGFHYNYLLREKLILKTGLRFASTGYRSRQGLGLTDADREMLSQSNLQQRSYKGYDFNIQLLEIPLGIRYVYSENWCKSYIETSLSANHYLRTKIVGADKGGHKDFLIVEQNIKPWSYAASLAIGAEFLLRKTIPAFIQLTSRYELTPHSVGPIEERFVAMGVETGLRYGF
jgi:hypothetical protein